MAQDSPARVDGRNYGHTFGEAFMLMTYHCEQCRHQERIWNSRDGVTPFFCGGCPSCGSNMQHVNWHDDQYLPHHQLRDGERYWRDGTSEEAVTIMQARFDAMRETYPLPPEQEAAMLDQVRAGTSSEFQPGWPKLDTHTTNTEVPV